MLDNVLVKSYCHKIGEVLKHLDATYHNLFATTKVQLGDGILIQMMLLHRLRPAPEMDAEKRLQFRISLCTLSFGPWELFLVSGFHIGRCPR